VPGRADEGGVSDCGVATPSATLARRTLCADLSRQRERWFLSLLPRVGVVTPFPSPAGGRRCPAGRMRVAYPIAASQRRAPPSPGARCAPTSPASGRG